MERKMNKISLLSLLLLLLPGLTFAVSPDKALEMLKSGNTKFMKGKRNTSKLDRKRRKMTSANGQQPFATIIGCSDSRAPIEHIFSVGIGDLFVIRVAGNVIDVDEAGSIEYGVEHLGTPLFVVLGHSNCGAVTAVVRNDEVHGNIAGLVDNIIPAANKAKQKYGDKFSEELLNHAIKLNIWQSIEDLLKISPITRQRLKKGQLKIVGAFYDLESGQVDWLGEHPGQELLLKKYANKSGADHH